MLSKTKIILLQAVLPWLLSCGFGEKNIASLWTDRPEFLLYAEHFNASQNTYKIEAHYVESPAQKLTGASDTPDIAADIAADIVADIVAASWLKSASTMALFSPLDPLFKQELISASAFYPRLLAQGNIEGRQYLLPVSFNIPAIVFPREYGETLKNPFTITLEEIRERGKAFNSETNGVYTRMGFSPAWDDSFLFILATLYNASFREASPIAWDAAALEDAMDFAYLWTLDANGGVQAEDDFAFKYLYDPPSKLVLSGRILFAYMESSRFFTLPEERRSGLDFRWIAQGDLIPLVEDNVYLGIYKKSKAHGAARAFAVWFFQTETQRALLQSARDQRIDETSFGIAGGFSGMRTVTEQVFPRFYQDLLGHMPPETFLSPPAILPRNWMDLKEQVILPYLRERARVSGTEDIRPLEKRVSDWYRLNRGS